MSRGRLAGPFIFTFSGEKCTKVQTHWHKRSSQSSVGPMRGSSELKYVNGISSVVFYDFYLKAHDVRGGWRLQSPDESCWTCMLAQGSARCRPTGSLSAFVSVPTAWLGASGMVHFLIFFFFFFFPSPLQWRTRMKRGEQDQYLPLRLTRTYTTLARGR